MSASATLQRRQRQLSRQLEDLARGAGLSVERYGGRFLVIEGPRGRAAFAGAMGSSIGHAMQLFAESVVLTRDRWSRAGLPTGWRSLFARTDQADAWQALGDLGDRAMVGSVVLGRGRNHVVSSSSWAQFDRAWGEAAAATSSGRLNNRLLLEPVPEGRDVRVSVVGSEVSAIWECAPARFNGRDWAAHAERQQPRSGISDAERTEASRLAVRALEHLPAIPYSIVHLSVAQGADQDAREVYEEATVITAELRNIELAAAPELPDDGDIVRDHLAAILRYEVAGNADRPSG